MTSSATSRHVGASLTFESLTPLPRFPLASVTEETEDGNDYLDVLAEGTDADESFAERWEAVATEHDPVLRYATTCSFLPGRDSLHNITTCSLAIEYDRDIDDLYRATACFLGNCHDGECTCLDDRRSTYCVPGENFVLTDKNDDFRLSFSHPTVKAIYFGRCLKCVWQRQCLRDIGDKRQTRFVTTSVL
ncbi:hypothetical protein BKA58DRAFT_377838 [Alternaria rosae]|uniref:uncharacterized protein n=1 Tax=Alternaria rosae TaxID=1187941 RepID=UPI001E8D0A62|nr:uncharacterized protein BKA58DRAFT_377838 [Alternaria rosae]KAH6878704.1 hypothetical protein BKA58DRAFT_377838 [Alternaria rosae]